MASNPEIDLDRGLAEIRLALEGVEAPSRVKPTQMNILYDSAVTESKLNLTGLPAWLTAACIAIIVVSVLLIIPDWSPEHAADVPVTESTPSTGYLVTHTQIPVRIFSLARGPEIRYVDASLVRDDRGMTQTIILNTP